MTDFHVCKKLDEVLKEKGGNYILPFLWMHGEEESVIREEMEKIRKCKIGAVCVESRPHPDFGGEKWWRDMDIVMDEARRHNMKVWLLDDDKFPTGHANGAFKEKHPELKKLYLAERHMDVLGPEKDAAVVIDRFLLSDSKLLAVLAVQKPDTETLAVDGEKVINLTQHVHDGIVYFDIPDGFWRIFVIYTTQQNIGNRGGRPDYMNLIDSRSVRVLIDAVYETHYQRYKDDFGKTFAGFFSDEPELGNTPGYDFNDVLGKRDVFLPWSDELEETLCSEWGENFAAKLPALWYDIGKQTAVVRSRYMDAVTSLVQKCFSCQMGEWCRTHGVEYIGHIIEDDNAHGHLGCSIGHYFRAQKGQDMSGIDVVLLQILPGFTETIHQWIASDRDGEFFHFGLAKLGSSLAHIDPAKQGRSMCEIFGAYGWAEGIGLMRWLTDHMLVRGVNVFVPHGFSPMFPDKDCPPHFYARGNNPQYRFFARLMPYMNRLSHLLNGGVHLADAAVLYHAESEWSGKAMLFQKPVRQLLEHQLDCDVVPADLLGSEGVKAENGRMWINGVSYQALVLPACNCIPDGAAQFAVQAAKAGVMVYMLEALPKACCSGQALPKDFAGAVKVIPLCGLADTFKNDCGSSACFSKNMPWMRFSRYRQQDSEVLMFFNEHPHHSSDFTITLQKEEACPLALTRYDAFDNTVCGVQTEQSETQIAWQVSLAPGQAAVYVLTRGQQVLPVPVQPTRSMTVTSEWEVSIADAKEYPLFKKACVIAKNEPLPNMNSAEFFPHFTGTFRYEGRFSMPADYKKDGRVLLELPKVGDCAEVSVNNTYAGMGIGNPFVFDITEQISTGENTLCIEVTNTLVWQMHDGQSTHMQLSPTGLLASPVIHF